MIPRGTTLFHSDESGDLMAIRSIIVEKSRPAFVFPSNVVKRARIGMHRCLFIPAWPRDDAPNRRVVLSEALRGHQQRTSRLCPKLVVVVETRPVPSEAMPLLFPERNSHSHVGSKTSYIRNLGRAIIIVLYYSSVDFDVFRESRLVLRSLTDQNEEHRASEIYLCSLR